MELKARVPGKGEVVGRLFKHLSPVTLTKLMRAVPLDGHANMFEKNFAYILTNVVTGEEKSRKEFKKGEIAFMPAGCMVCFFLEDTKSYKPMNPLGQVIAGMPVLEALRRGDTIQIESIRPLSSG